MDVAERFGANLYRARKRAGLSQEALGFAAGLHRTEVGLLERGQRIPADRHAGQTRGRPRCRSGSAAGGDRLDAARIASGGFGVEASGPGSEDRADV